MTSAHIEAIIDVVEQQERQLLTMQKQINRLEADKKVSGQLLHIVLALLSTKGVLDRDVIAANLQTMVEKYTSSEAGHEYAEEIAIVRKHQAMLMLPDAAKPPTRN